MRKFLSAALLLALAVVPAGAKGPAVRYAAPAPAGVEKKDVGATVPSPIVEKQVAKLTSKVHWHSDLEEAKAEAKKQNKMIFWLHALGDLDGVC
jgi:hypothetical protein